MNLVLFASGSGSNAENVCRHFQNHPDIKITALFCNTPNAAVIKKMERFKIPVVLFNRETFKNQEQFLSMIEPYRPDYIALLGFLWKIPVYLVQAYPHKIINLHPALLPKYGGKGMYGHYVHEAVKQSGETETGITLHWVNEHYDEGEIIAQFKCKVESNDTPEMIADKIHVLEQQHVPEIIENLLK
ncbi:MAG: phosphoribosylglycinamide formyltransferase [Bacteroidota bacterium]|nr:phosphoribosylglycinamide formyltransferase [Bacteroidota bacterium]